MNRPAVNDSIPTRNGSVYAWESWELPLSDTRLWVMICRATSTRLLWLLSADIVVVTGGLGPTLDDLTRQAMAEAFNVPLELDVESLKKIELMFAQCNREMPERNRVQAMFPRGSRVIPNPHGHRQGLT